MPEQERRRFGAEERTLAEAMRSAYRTADDLESQHGAILSAALQNQQAWAQGVLQTLTTENPELAQRAKNGDAEARTQLQALLLNKLAADPQLLQDPRYDASTAALLRFQFDQLHEIEARQRRETLRVPLPRQEQEQRVAEVAQEFGSREGFTKGQLGTVQQNGAYQELLASVAAANQAVRDGVLPGGMEPMVAESRKVWDTPGDPVVQAGETVRSSMRDLAAVELRSQLNFAHLEANFGNSQQRQALASSRNEQTAHVAAEALAAGINGQALASEGYRRLDNIKVPPPPPVGTDSQGWAKTVGDEIQAAGIQIHIILLGNK